MFRTPTIAATALGLACLLSCGGAPASAQENVRHPHMHHALRELRETRIELKEAAHDFGGHRAKALEAVDVAIGQIDKALRAAGDNIKGAGKVDPGIYKKYTHHPHLHHAIHELREARTELQDAKHDFGGHRAKALRDVDYAIEQLELALKFARK
jgi:esterase/lipase superfamily enzyme